MRQGRAGLVGQRIDLLSVDIEHGETQGIYFGFRFQLRKL